MEKEKILSDEEIKELANSLTEQIVDDIKKNLSEAENSEGKEKSEPEATTETDKENENNVSKSTGSDNQEKVIEELKKEYEELKAKYEELQNNMDKKIKESVETIIKEVVNAIQGNSERQKDDEEDKTPVMKTTKKETEIDVGEDNDNREEIKKMSREDMLKAIGDEILSSL